MNVDVKKRISRFFPLLLVLLLIVTACVKHHEAEKTADQLVDEGRTHFEKKDYKDAITSYKKLKDWYPFSVHAKEAELKVADAHYKLKEYDQAISAYKDFSQLHPNDPQVPYAMYQIGKCYYDRMETPDRDQTAATNAIDAFRNLIVAFPDSEYTQKAQADIKKCQKNLAENEMYIAKFYFKSKHYKAALARFEDVVKDYPDFGFQSEARDYISRCQLHTQD